MFSKMPNSYKATLQYLYEQLPMFHRIGAAAYKPNLSNTLALMKMLGHPEQQLKCVHIAGTNGKGSTSHMLASVLQESGYKTGLYTSPHLKDFRERIRINGKMISKKVVVDFVNRYRSEFDEIKPSFFEWSVCLAFHYFHTNKVDVAIIEAGLGGRLDSTNVVNPLVSVITNIGWDHMALLGNTLEKIASEKAGIIKRGVPVVVGSSLNISNKIFKERAAKLKAPYYPAAKYFKVKGPLQVFRSGQLFFSGQLYVGHGGALKKRIYSDLPGLYQQKNIEVVLCVVNILKKQYGFKINEMVLYNGLKYAAKNTGLKGRWQLLKKRPLTICDVAHNTDGMGMVLEQLKSIKYAHLHLVVGMVNDKDVTAVLKMLPASASYYFCKARIPRALDHVELSKQALALGLTGRAYSSVKGALNAAKKAAAAKDLILVTGSVFTVAEIVK